ncbi:MAG: CBS domain-containing protein [Eubacteriales bacterium]|nr:CBS domain-containing protein [Eubacteriales bacterium]
MNIAFFLIPKSDVAFLYDDYSLRQGLEKMKHHGYTAIPVINKEGKYLNTISEGDFLWHILKDESETEELTAMPMQSLELDSIRDLLGDDKNPPVSITASPEKLLSRALEQNFIPVIDDSGSFIGIVTRRDILKYFLEPCDGRKGR